MHNNYLVSARKYRPQRFGELVAQDHVIETLRNAIRLDRLAHAYLFSGPRGVGKTTAARILAKAINCSTPLDQRPDVEPCFKCDSCLSFDGSRNLNVIEIDAASNNKVEDMRELRDTVRIPPQGGTHKVYIIDEVHMLTTQAFNALLKTLEEPPPYAMFIFATTEPHKVLPTIQSRCQRFDFHRIDVERIVEHLKHIAGTEGVTADEGSYMLIARKGDGALRDALSAFDQAISLCGRDIRYDELADAFRVVDEDRYFEITRCVVERDSAAVLRILDDLVGQGYDLPEFLAGLLEHLRNLLVALSMGSTELIEATDEVRDRYKRAANEIPEADLLRMMMVTSATEESLKSSRQQRLTAELGLLKLVHLSSATDLTELVRMVKSAGLSQLARGQQHRVQKPPEGQPSARSQRVRPDTADSPKPKPKARPEASRSAAADEPADAVAPASAPMLFGSPALKTPPRPAEQHDASASGSPVLSLVLPESADRSSLKSIDNVWLAFVRSVKSDRIHVGSLLQHGSPSNLEGTTLQVAVPDDFHRRLLSNQADFLLGHLDSLLPGQVKRFSFAIRHGLAVDSGETEDSFDPLEYMQRKRAESPIVRAIFDEFGGELVW